jgi:hypothetical protein
MRIFAALYLIILTLALPPLALAAQWAVVKTNYSIIYAHPDRTSPIGYIQSGKKIRVGDVIKRQGAMLPTLVSGKVAWISAADLILKDEQDTDYHRLERQVFNESGIPLSSSRTEISIEVGVFQLGPEWSQYGQTANAEAPSPYGTSFHLRGKYWRSAQNPFGFGIGLKYYTASDGLLSFSSLGGMASISFRLMQAAKGTIELDAGLFYSPQTEFSIVLLGDELSDTGTSLGFEFGARGTYYLHPKYHLLGALGINTLKPNITTKNEAITVDLSNSTFTGYQVYLGVAYLL